MEELTALFDQPGDEMGAHAVFGDVEKTALSTGAVDLSSDVRTAPESVNQLSDVDDRNMREVSWHSRSPSNSRSNSNHLCRIGVVDSEHLHFAMNRIASTAAAADS